jgi:hypothetical protein
MAILGAPNVGSGANPSGTGSGLNYVGNHVYAISGSIEADNNNTTLLDFTTGGTAYIVAELQIGSDAGSGDDFRYSVEFNGEAIMDSYAQRTDQGFPNFGFPFKFIIPPETRVTIKADNITSGTARSTYATIMGEVYA